MKKYRISVILTILTLAVVYILTNIFKLVGNIVMPMFQERFDMTSRLTGFITGSYYIAYAPLQFLAAPLSHKFGAERVIGSSLILGALGAFLWSIAPNSTTVLIGRLLLGLGVGPAYIGTLYYISKYAIDNDYTIFSGILLAAGGLGSVVSSLPLSILIEKRGANEVFLVIGAIMVALSLLLFVLFFLNKKGDNNISIQDKASTNVWQNLKDSVKYVFKYPPLLLGVFMWGMFNSYQLCYQGLWSAKWARVAYPEFTSIAGLTGSICSLGFVISSVISEPMRRKNRLTTVKRSEYYLSLLGFLTIAVHLIVYISGVSRTLLYIVKCISDFFLGYTMGHFCIQMTAFTKNITRSDMNANVMGLMNGGGSLLCLLFQYLTGQIYDISHKTLNPNLSYALAFTVVATILLAFAISTANAQEKYKDKELN